MTPKDNELRMQVGLVITHTDDELLFVRSEKNPNVLDALQEFAELIRADERDKCAQDYLQDCCDAVEAARLEEREACAKLCLELVQAKASGESYEDGTIDCAAAIRARGEK